MGFSQVPQSGCQRSGAHLEKHCQEQVPALQIRTLPISQTPTNRIASRVNTSVCACILLLDFSRNGRQICSNPNPASPKQGSPPLRRRPHSTHLYPCSQFLPLCAQTVRTVCVFRRLQPHLFTCTHLCFSFSPIKL